MASPQKENGYTAISNELLMAVVRTPLPGRHKDILLFVMRKTYGFGKKRDYISLSQFTAGTKIDRSGVCKIIKDLVAGKLLEKKGSIYAIKKDYESWGVAARTLGGSGVANNLVVAHTPHTKETITKERNTHRTSGATSKKKSMAWRKEHNEDNPSDYIPTVDADTGETRAKKEDPEVKKAYELLLKWAEERRGFKFTYRIKQFGAMKTMRNAKISVDQVKERWIELENEGFYKEKGMDFMSVSSSFDKRPPTL